ncbi:Nucleotidyltransferase/DNA polymerase DinP involved in DNA repair (DinP) (PDB:4R8U) (PUBMED:16544291) [Commensalibacter communis]|nr:Nucleotidyltransferase/DNA polymerase DinP involved in DNA repair (DinP) (PDB:4R8U) (PUBMED:16544291) [Commensalibacter communis]
MLDLVDKDKRQLDFFSNAENEDTKARNETLIQTLNKINKKTGRHTVSFGGINKKDS